MTFEEARQGLHKGVLVYWTVPDREEVMNCSRSITIAHASFHGDEFICLVAEDESVVECLPKELSFL